VKADMKFRADIDDWSTNLNWVVRLLPNNPVLPATNGVRIDADDGIVTMTVTDPQLCWASASFPAHVEQPGSVLLPARLLAKTTGKFPKQPIDMAADASEATLRCGRAEMSLHPMDLEDFPLLEVAIDGVHVDLPTGVLARTITQVARAASTDDSTRSLTGINLEVDGTQFTAAATDKYRLAARSFERSSDSTPTVAVVVPAKVLNEVAKAINGTDVSTVSLTIASDAALFTIGDRKIRSLLIDAPFPDWRKLIPAGEHVVTFNRADLIETVTRVAQVRESLTTPLMMTFENDMVTVACQGVGRNAMQEPIPADIPDGLPVDSVAVNPDYLLGGLDATGADRIEFRMTAPMKPIVLTVAPDENGVVEPLTYLLMPMRVS
jgi:DNA polymerase-3 subunit beta